jgi:four helix bundle protein
MRPLDHEQLQVYRRAIEFVTWSDDVVAGIRAPCVLKDHLERAAFSIPVSIADANGHYSTGKRRPAAEVAYGSALECAACLDLATARELLAPRVAAEGKGTLSEIVAMLLALRTQYRATSGIRDDETPYECAPEPRRVFFSHERLIVYQRTLELAAWLSGQVAGERPPAMTRDLLDRSVTSVALNIAEGNGRFPAADRIRFLDTAHSAVLKCAAALDIWAAKDGPRGEDLAPGKGYITEIVSMLVGLRKSIKARQPGG